MRDESVPELQSVVPLESLGGLALEALRHLARLRTVDTSDIDLVCLDRFLTALCDDWNDDPDQVIRTMGALRVRMDALVARYIPAAARDMGERWKADTVSFTDVTLCGARLHMLLRRIEEVTENALQDDGPSILLLVPPDETHTLGASVAATQLRAAGFSVCLRVNPGSGELAQLLATRRFDLVLLSVSCVTGAANAAGLIRVLRLSGKRDLPIVVGGPVPLTDTELLSATQADRVMRELSHVIAEYLRPVRDAGLE